MSIEIENFDRDQIFLIVGPSGFWQVAKARFAKSTVSWTPNLVSASSAVGYYPIRWQAKASTQHLASLTFACPWQQTFLRLCLHLLIPRDVLKTALFPLLHFEGYFWRLRH